MTWRTGGSDESMAQSFGARIVSARRLDGGLDAAASGSGGDALDGGTEILFHLVRVGAGPAARAVPERQAAFRLQYPRQSGGDIPCDAAGAAPARGDSRRA